MRSEFSKSEQEAQYEAAELLGKLTSRKDMFPSQLEDGRYVAIKEPLTTKHLFLHLEGHITLGTYMLAPDSMTNKMVIDADQEDGLKNLSKLAIDLDKEGIPSYLETSRRGGHLWFFFDHPYEGEKIRTFGKAVMQVHDVSKVELYPKQDRLFGGPGSLVRLPFGRHKLSGQRYPFIYPDRQLLAPTIREQIYILSAHQNVPEAAIDTYMAYQPEIQKPRVRDYSIETVGSTDVERIKSAIPLMDFLEGFIDLKPVASGAVGRCPFHDDHHPSFGVNREGNYWQCFAGCGGGTIIDFWMKWKGVNFPTAVQELKDYFGVDTQR